MFGTGKLQISNNVYLYTHISSVQLYCIWIFTFIRWFIAVDALDLYTQRQNYNL